MNRLAYILSGLLMAGAGLQAVEAQQVVPPGHFRIGPYPAMCGSAVTVLAGPQVGDVARATVGQIHLNAPAFFSLSLPAQMFVYAHECAHAQGIFNEAAADCFAIRIGVQQGWVNPMTLPHMCASIFSSPGDWSHLPGPQRCQLMLACTQ